MTAPNRASGIGLGLFIALLLSGCAPLSIPGITAPVVGHVTGRIEEGGRGVSVIHLQAVAPQRTPRHAKAQSPVFIEGGQQQPRIAVVRPDEPLRLANLDAIYHEIFTADAENPFRVRLSGGEESGPIALRTPGFVRGYCRLHPHESYGFLVTRAEHVLYLEGDPVFNFPNVPVGEYRIGAAGLDGESSTTQFWVLADQTAQLTLRLEPRVEH